MKQLVVTNAGEIINAVNDRPNKEEISISNAMTARNFEHKTLKNSDGSPLRARRNGQTKTWKREPGKFQIPCKHGLKQCFYITNSNADQWYIPQ